MMNQNADMFIEAATIFLPHQKQLNFYEIKGGVNNWTKGLLTSNGDYVVRIYNNGKNLQKVKIEHELLLILQKTPKSFSTPEPLRIPGTEQTIAVLKEGYPCCITKKIEGTLPKQFTKEGLENFGYSVAQLSNILANVKLSQTPLIKPYFDLYGVHHYVQSREKLVQEISSKSYDSVRDSANKLLQYIKLTQQKMGEYHELKFPMQLIHGDIHTDNILMKDDKMMGILDFQFVAEDWRAMQVPISLSKYVNQSNFVQVIRDFMRGYRKVGSLSEPELMAIPWLIILRLVSNFVYFASRAMAGEDTVELCKEKIQLYRQRIDKLMPRIEELQKVLLQQ